MDDRLVNGASPPHDHAAAVVVGTLEEVLALLGAGRAQRVRVRNGRFELDVTLYPDVTGVRGTTENDLRTAPTPAEPSSADARLADPEPTDIAITAPAIGVFHRRPAPGEPPLVEVGDLVVAGDELGLIEAMKAFTPVVADRAGTVSAIHVEDAQVVEYGQVLVDLRPDPADGPMPREGAP